MSASNFYQTFYQTEQLFRLADEVWDVVDITTDQPAPSEALNSVPEPVLVAPEDSTDFLAELERLATVNVILAPDELIETPDVLLTFPTEVPSEPVPAPAIVAPQPLPQPAPRPTVPSILPPIQQPARLPQLNHKVLLLADEELDPGNLLFLEKILKAVNLNVNGVDLLNLRGTQNMDFAELVKGKYINHFITFGVPFERINLDIMMDRYAPVRFEGITFLMADSLPTIEADQNLKKRLWAALQRVFLQRYA